MIKDIRFLRFFLLTVNIICYIPSSICNLNASDKEIINLGRFYIANGEYYNAITEMMRYQSLFPEGEYFPDSLLLMAKAYYEGDNYHNAVDALSECYSKFKNRQEGERALFYLGYLRLLRGSPYYAFRTYQEYQYIYKEGKYYEDAAFDMCMAAGLMGDLKGALREIAKYRRVFAEGSYKEDADKLESLIIREINRPSKSLWISLIGSIFVPGFGHFYTGKYKVGFFSFFTNAALAYLIYDGYKDRNKFRMILFSMGEIAVYNYSLYSAVNNVYIFNKRDSFYKAIRLSFNRKF